jgi:rhodanese-related sulfurtransferase
MNLISREELKEKLDRGDDFKLVMVLGEWAFLAKHIPGSINISSPDQCRKMLSSEDEIVVYCSGVACVSSMMAYKILVDSGFQNVRRYAGGLPDWEDAGYALEGEMVHDI